MARFHPRHASLSRQSGGAHEFAAGRLHAHAHHQQGAAGMETLDDAAGRTRRAGGNLEMNLRDSIPQREDKAFTLIELLVYMSMLLVIIALGYTALYRSMDASTGLRRNASDITHALNAGERWREDVRAATRPLRIER